MMLVQKMLVFPFNFYVVGSIGDSDAVLNEYAESGLETFLTRNIRL